MLLWFPDFSERAMQLAQTRFYRGVLRMTIRENAPSPSVRPCAREAVGGSKGRVCGLFCDAWALIRIGVSLKNPLTIFGL